MMHDGPDHGDREQPDDRQRQHAEPSERERACRATEPGRRPAERVPVDERGPSGVVVGGHDQRRPAWRSASSLAGVDTTFWLARSGVRRRPGETPVSTSAAIETSATASRAPRRGVADRKQAAGQRQRDVPGVGQSPVRAAPERLGVDLVALGSELAHEPPGGAPFRVGPGSSPLESRERGGRLERSHRADDRSRRQCARHRCTRRRCLRRRHPAAAVGDNRTLALPAPVNVDSATSGVANRTLAGRRTPSVHL